MTDLIAVDVGGTFTDVVALRGGVLEGRKVPTTQQQSDGVVEAAEGSPGDRFLHGTTTATNTLLEGTGAKVALVASPGYEDLIEIARQDRPSLYDSARDRPDPLVARQDRFSSDLGAREIARRAAACDVVAIGLIESHQDPSGEALLARELRELSTMPVVVASEVSPEFREYERLATTVLSAYLTPSVDGYLRDLDARLSMKSRLVMTSSGGLIPFGIGANVAGRLVLSGPAGGVVAAAALARFHGLEQVLSFDMGGTSTDVCRITHGEIAVGREHTVAGRVNRVPSVPVQTIGAGGGSIGWVDPGGALRVGPHSAGANPGPASYGKGGNEPTVTDAHLLAGNLHESIALAGTIRLRRAAALEVVTRLGERIGLGPDSTAEGMLEIADSHMVHALRSVSVEQGADPREATLVAFGGAGGLHAVRVAREMGMQSVMIPPFSGVFSALGLAMAVPRTDVARTVMLSEDDPRYYQAGRDLVGEARARYVEMFRSDPENVQRTCDVRYVGQSHELEVDGEGSWHEMRYRFERAHLTRYGFQRPDEPIEVVNARATASGQAPLAWAELPGPAPGVEPVFGDGAWVRDTLPAGFSVEGPTRLIETNSVVLVGHGERMVVLDDGTLRITWA
ncbi:MAG: hydantoinase/oxoprolinase family protein [Acidimicrobiia bacterium]|nr:hydantoinase/oxoprolinase family protein [Acidimicrobiia bacterium]